MESDTHCIQWTAKISKQMRWLQLQSERQKTQPGLNYISNYTAPNAILHFDHEWNYHTNTKVWFSLLLFTGQRLFPRFLYSCHVAESQCFGDTLWPSSSITQTLADTERCLLHLQETWHFDSNFCISYLQAFLRGYLINISLANITLHVHTLVYMMALNSHVL